MRSHWCTSCAEAARSAASIAVSPELKQGVGVAPPPTPSLS
jgi:hypothetical protein